MNVNRQQPEGLRIFLGVAGAILLFVTACDAFVPPPAPLATKAPSPTATLAPTMTATIPPTLAPTATPEAPVPAVAPAPPVPGEPLDFADIDMIDPDVGWGIDTHGRILRTTDGGDTWTLASPPDGAYTLNGFYALDGNTAWAAKDVPVRCWDYWGLYECQEPYYAPVRTGVVWRTTNGGQTWLQSQPFPLDDGDSSYTFDGALPFSPVGLQFLDGQTGWLLVAVG